MPWGKVAVVVGVYEDNVVLLALFQGLFHKRKTVLENKAVVMGRVHAKIVKGDPKHLGVRFDGRDGGPPCTETLNKDGRQHAATKTHKQHASGTGHHKQHPRHEVRIEETRKETVPDIGACLQDIVTT
jgi:hypothetical protein